MDKSITCCFTGHRPAKLPWGFREDDPRCLRLKEELAARLEGLYEAGYRHFICGMAAGCDLYFAEAVLALRSRREGVALEAAVPCLGQDSGWPAAQRRRYAALTDACDKVTLLQRDYSPGCMQRRNEYMVDRSSALLACFDGQPGGTMNTIRYALRRGCKVIQIDLDSAAAPCYTFLG